MLKHIVTRVGTTTYCLRNKTLLLLVQDVARDDLPRSVPPLGTGGSTKWGRGHQPWNLEDGNVGKWIWTFKNLRGGDYQYMYIGGRVVMKTLKYNTRTAMYENSYYRVRSL